jgi:alanine racemase
MTHAPRLIVSLSQIQQNWLALQARSAGECAAVVKANGYGLGALEVTTALIKAGAKSFFVAHLSEGIALRKTCVDIDVYVLNGLPQGEVETYKVHNLTPVLGSYEELKEWGNAAPFALMVDTGMNRLGFAMDDLPICAPALVMSHFACSDEPSHPLNALQIKRFAEVRAQYPHAKASLANSDGIAFKEAHHDMVRPGIALFQDVVTLKAKVIQSRFVKKGESVGYGASFIAQENTPLTLVNLGYADGFMRQGQGGFALYKGARIPILGRISMDIIALGCTAQRGEEVTFLGEGLSQKQVAASMNTISYELLTRLGNRFERHYL